MSVFKFKESVGHPRTTVFIAWRHHGVGVLLLSLSCHHQHRAPRIRRTALLNLPLRNRPSALVMKVRLCLAATAVVLDSSHPHVAVAMDIVDIFKFTENTYKVPSKQDFMSTLQQGSHQQHAGARGHSNKAPKIVQGSTGGKGRGGKKKHKCCDCSCFPTDRSFDGYESRHHYGYQDGEEFCNCSCSCDISVSDGGKGSVPPPPTPSPIVPTLPSPAPAVSPTPAPGQSPTPAPLVPTVAPKTEPPTQAPTGIEPTAAGPQTESPTQAPTGIEPTTAPETDPPTQAPTGIEPTVAPKTEPPTQAPTGIEPTEAPQTATPTQAPTGIPIEPTEAPQTATPTQAPTGIPIEPTEAPQTATPTQAPTEIPIEPTEAPQYPTGIEPTLAPQLQECQINATIQCKTSDGTDCDKVEPPPSRFCSTEDPIDVVLFSYQPSCNCTESDNGQNGIECEDLATLVDGPVTVTCIDLITTTALNVAPTTVNPREAFSVLPNNSAVIDCSIMGQDGTSLQRNTIDVSGEESLNLGDKFGALQLEGCNDRSCKEVFCYEVDIENIGTTALNITTFDFTFNGDEESLLRNLPSTVLGVGESASVEAKVVVDVCEGQQYFASTRVEADPSPLTSAGVACEAEDEYVVDIPPIPSPPPTSSPTQAPVEPESPPPTEGPTQEPETEPPTQAPTSSPTQAPIDPDTSPPTDGPTQAPTSSPTQAPMDPDSPLPTEGPTQAPTGIEPTAAPETEPPTQAPTGIEPTTAPESEPPTQAPTGIEPTQGPEMEPTQTPTESCDIDINVECSIGGDGTVAGNVCSSLQIGIERCIDRPFEATMRFNGGSCDQSFTTQTDDFECTDFSNGPPTGEGEQAYIMVTDLEDAEVVYFRGFVDVGDTYVLFDGSRFAADQAISIWANENITDPDNLLQTLKYHSSCSQNLFLKDRFGASQLVGFKNEDQGIVTCMETFVYSINIGVPPNSGIDTITLTNLTAILNDETLYDLTDQVAGQMIQAGEPFLTAELSVIIDASIRQEYRLTASVDGMHGEGARCDGMDTLTFQGGTGLPPGFPTVEPTVTPTTSPAPTVDPETVACDLQASIECSAVSSQQPCVNIRAPTTLSCTSRDSTSLTWRLVTGDCDSMPKTNSTSFECTDSGDSQDGIDTFVVTVESDSVVSSFEVPRGGFFTMMIFERDTNFNITDEDSGTLLQSLIASTRCEEENDLTLGKRFGALELVGFTNSSGSNNKFVEIENIYEVYNPLLFEANLLSATYDVNGENVTTIELDQSPFRIDPKETVVVLRETFLIDVLGPDSFSSSFAVEGEGVLSEMSCQDSTRQFLSFSP